MSDTKITSARLVPLGRNGIETAVAAVRSWDVELTLSTGQTQRLNAKIKVRGVALAYLGSVLREIRALGVDGRQVVRAACESDARVFRPVAKCLPAHPHLAVIAGGRSR